MACSFDGGPWCAEMLVDSDLRVAGDVLRKNGHTRSDLRARASMTNWTQEMSEVLSDANEQIKELGATGREKWLVMGE